MSDEKDKSDENENKGVRIQDKRRFDAEGNERDRAQAPEARQPAEKDPASAAGVIQDARATSGGEEESINFSSFIMSLATQTLMQLGEMKPPPGISIDIDKDAARQTIDILRLLQRKTKGNLDQAEDKLLDEILHALMMSYVKASQ